MGWGEKKKIRREETLLRQKLSKGLARSHSRGINWSAKLTRNLIPLGKEKKNRGAWKA